MSPYRYHHIGIPSLVERENEEYIADDGVYASGYFNSPHAIEWLRFAPDSPLPDLIKRVPHVAFVVDHLDNALHGQEVLLPPRSPAPGVRVAFIVDNGAPVELIEFLRSEHEVWPHAWKVFEGSV
ncbi:VOC family protein [Pseudomarimonas arenosa]|uniref:Glyoxalase n=1 Tax=Pseudomarimonas arenosa TaxID=2774145 RepID=A0AAW3ZPL4_9GAMM|nr:hypothetical protein [Pseudomarimonas arenosa]MBD8527663.1 hypothetical protein [Pseudomarimonas arenosa]